MTHKNDKPTGAVSGIIGHACLVTFTGFDSEALGGKAPCLLTGTMLADHTGRFGPDYKGMAFKSSLVVDVTGDRVTTHNSLYQVNGPLDHVSLDKKYFHAVQDFIDPRNIEGLLKAGFEFVTDEQS